MKNVGLETKSTDAALNIGNNMIHLEASDGVCSAGALCCNPGGVMSGGRVVGGVMSGGKAAAKLAGGTMSGGKVGGKVV